MTRDEFMDVVYDELYSDGDNNRANRIIDAADSYADEYAQPERIKGRWIEIALSNHTYKCSVCGRLLVNITEGKNNVAKKYPYCHCGADMREVTE